MKRLALAIVVLVFAPTATFAVPLILLEDNFNDNSIDPTKWSVVTSGIPQASASVTETGGRMQLVNRGHLNTAQQFKPDDPAIGGIKITGQWTFTIALDYFQILTRSDGIPSGPAGETSNAIEFHMNNEEPYVQIYLRDGLPTEVLATSAPTQLTNTATGTFDFVITDDGNQLTFLMSEVGNPANSASTSATYSSSFLSNYVTFHNRENRFFQSNTALLDNVKIESLTLVPEPGGFLMSLMALMAMAALQRSRSTSRLSP